MDLYRFRLPGFEQPYIRKRRNQGFLVILQTGRKSESFFQESSEEMYELARSAGIQIVGTLQAFIPHPSPSHFLREGKLNQVLEEAGKVHADILIFNVDL